MANQSLKKTRWLGTAHVSNNRISFLPEDKKFAKSIKERTSNRLKKYSRWINNKMRKEILKYYYSIDNDTWLCDKAILFQS